MRIETEYMTSSRKALADDSMTLLAIPVKSKISDLCWPLTIRGVAESPAQSVRHQIDLHARWNEVILNIFQYGGQRRELGNAPIDVSMF